MIFDGKRRAALLGLGTLALGGATFSVRAASSPDRIVPPGARNLSELIERLRQAPRRRDFKSVPMIVANSDFWDAKALNEVIAYSGAYKQVWDNTDIASPWLNLMRNAVNAQMGSAAMVTLSPQHPVVSHIGDARFLRLTDVDGQSFSVPLQTEFKVRSPH